MAITRALCPIVVGREAELTELEDALLEALRGQGGVVLLGGEAGVGKSRLAADLSGRAERLGARALLGACSEADLALPYLPFLEAVGNHLSRSDLPALGQRLGPAVSELAQLFPQLGQAPAQPGDPSQAKLRLFEALVALLHDAAQPGGLLLVVEDIHWADPSSRELLDYLTRRLRAERVLVLATYRRDEMHRRHPLQPVIQGWRRAGSVREVELSRLGPESVAGIVRAIFDQQDVSPEFRDFLHRRSEGNPFVLEEMLKDALDSGDIFRTADGWDRKAIPELRLPETVRDTILSRYERLTDEQREILAAAAVLGRAFGLDDLAAAAATSEDAVLEALRAAMLQQLVEEDAGGFRFRHALTREAVYEDLLLTQRRRLHRRAAEALRARGVARNVDLAHHLLAAGDAEAGARMCVAAAEEALAALAPGDAAALFELAAGHAEGQDRGLLLCRAGYARWSNEEPGAARRLLEEGIPLLDAAGLPAEAARWRLELGRAWWELQRSDLAREQYERALEELGRGEPTAALALTHIRLSGLDSFEIREEEALDHARKALAAADAAGAPMEHAWAWNFAAIATCGLGRIAEGMEAMERSYAEAVAGGFPFQASNAVFNAVWINYHLGLGRAAHHWLDRAGDYSGVVWGTYIECLVALLEGRLEDAIAAGRRAVDVAAGLGHAKMLWRGQVGLAHALAEADRGSEALEVLPPLSSRVEVQDATYDTLARVRSAFAVGDRALADEAVRATPPLACMLGSPADALAEGAADAGWLAEFMSGLDLSDETRSTCLRLAVAEGRLALAQGDAAAAVEQLSRAVERWAEEGARVEGWHAERALAEAEAALGSTEAAGSRLRRVSADAAAAGAFLAARLAAESAHRLGFEVAAARGAAAGLPEATPAGVATGERLVTVLFVDVRGYTSLTGRTAPADLADRIGSLQRWAAAEVQRHHGVVDKFAGDAVMATFNISGASVDHAEHALAAAIAIRDKAAALGLGVGAGIAVGPAVVGRFAEGGNLSVLGEVTNLAARLQASSGAGEITLSSEARRRVPGRLKADSVQLELKGFDAPVTAYRVR